MARISELIDELQRVKDEHGDLKVRSSHYGERWSVSANVSVVEDHETGEEIAHL